jgi:hypothetical protein
MKTLPFNRGGMKLMTFNFLLFGCGSCGYQYNQSVAGIGVVSALRVSLLPDYCGYRCYQSVAGIFLFPVEVLPGYHCI